MKNKPNIKEKEFDTVKFFREVKEKIAKEKKVSVAWIVRDAAERYVNEQWPLLVGKG